MSLSRASLGVLAAVAAASSVQLSGATFSTVSTSQGRVGASPDWTPPTVAVDGASGLVRGTATITATAADAESTVRDVRIEYRPAGSAGAWTPLCTDATAPFSCVWDTTGVADGRYELQAVARDAYDNVATSATVVRTVDNRGPVVVIDEDALPDYLRGTVTVTALASDAGSGVASVLIQRSTNGTSWTDLCTDTSAPYSCSWTTSGSGDAFLRAIATDVLGSSTTSAVALVSLDNAAPTVSMASPGSPLAGTVTLTAAASDADSGVGSVLIEQRASSTSPWVAVCTDTTAPYSCRWDTTQVADGTTYTFRATATDNVGLAAVHVNGTSSTVDNRTASVSVEDPGAFLRGTVALLANANAPGGVASVAIQYAPTGTSTWTTVCTDTAFPYECSWDTTKVAGGRYDLRAVMTPVSGSTLISALVTGRTVDNSPLRGVDVQATNGGVLGRVDAGDVLTLTYDQTVNLDSVVAGWTGAPRTVGLRLRDGSAVGGVAGEDVFDVLTAPGATTSVGLGTVNGRANYIKGQAMTFSATMTAESVTVNGGPATRIVIRIDALTTADNGRTTKTGRTMTWTPSSAARDLAGNPAAAIPVDETGTLDRDF